MKSFIAFLNEQVEGKKIGSVGEYDIHFQHHGKGVTKYHVVDPKEPESSFHVTHEDFDHDTVSNDKHEKASDRVEDAMYDHLHKQVTDNGFAGREAHEIATKIHNHMSTTGSMRNHILDYTTSQD